MIADVKVHLNGQNYTLSYNSSSGKYEATITAPNVTSWNEPNNKYGLTVTATDVAGNSTVKDRTDSTLGTSLQLRVLEKTKPTINLTSPSSGARLNNSQPVIEFQLRDSGSGIDIDTLQLKIDGETTITNSSPGMVCTSVTGGYNCVYTPPTSLPEGSHTITISIKDNDGNTSNLLSSGFIIDTVPPSLNITNPSNNFITNQKTLVVQGTTNDSTSSPVVITIKLNNVDQGVVTKNDGAFSKSITLTEGLNDIVVTATDTSGLTTTVSRTVTLKTTAPTIESISLVPNPVDSGKTFIISVKVSD